MQFALESGTFGVFLKKRKSYSKSLSMRGNSRQIYSKLSLVHEKEQKGVLVYFETRSSPTIVYSSYNTLMKFLQAQASGPPNESPFVIVKKSHVLFSLT
jgi:hypothetical protein